MKQMQFIFDKYLLADIKNFQKPNGCTNSLYRPRFSEFLKKHWQDLESWPRQYQEAVLRKHKSMYRTDYEIGTYPIIAEVMDECWHEKVEYDLHHKREIFSWKYYNEAEHGNMTVVEWLFPRRT